jgi:periplasmic copper chaperone A
MKILFGLLFTILFLSAGNKIEVKNAWLRPANTGMNSALYLKIINNSDKADTLYKVTYKNDELTQMHKTVKKGNLTGMKMMPFIAIKSHSTFDFEPGKFHIMLINLTKDLKPGEKVNFELYFKSGEKVNATATVGQN